MKFPENDFTGSALKHAGQQLALENSGEWKDEVMQKMHRFARALTKGELFGMDEFRDYFRAWELPLPSSQNAWGSVPAMACKAGLIEETDQYTKSSLPSAHSRIIKLWRRK